MGAHLDAGFPVALEGTGGGLALDKFHELHCDVVVYRYPLVRVG